VDSRTVEHQVARFPEAAVAGSLHEVNAKEEAMTDMTEIQYFGFNCRVVSKEWAELIERDRLEKAIAAKARLDGAERTYVVRAA
jgi:hypothetical protein